MHFCRRLRRNDSLTKGGVRGIMFSAFAGMAELADALDSGSSDHYDSCRFKSCFPHQTNIIRTGYSLWEKGSDYSFISIVTRTSTSEMEW